jgi:hypothetical protein
MITENALSSVLGQSLAVPEERLTRNENKVCFYSSKFENYRVVSDAQPKRRS